MASSGTDGGDPWHLKVRIAEVKRCLGHMHAFSPEVACVFSARLQPASRALDGTTVEAVRVFKSQQNTNVQVAQPVQAAQAAYDGS